MLHREHLPGAAEAGLDFIDDQRYFEPVADLPHLGHEAWIGHDRTALALDRLDQDAGRSGGRLVTVPLEIGGRSLELNMNAGAGGRIKVELLGTAGKPVPGHTREDADWLWGNDVRKRVTWDGRSDLSRLRGKTVRLHFIGLGVKLYAFQFGK